MPRVLIESSRREKWRKEEMINVFVQEIQDFAKNLVLLGMCDHIALG